MEIAAAYSEIWCHGILLVPGGGEESLAEIGSGGGHALRGGAAVAAKHIVVSAGDGKAVHQSVVGAVSVLELQVLVVGGDELGVSVLDVLEDGPGGVGSAIACKLPASPSSHDVDGGIVVARVRVGKAAGEGHTVALHICTKLFSFYELYHVY